MGNLVKVLMVVMVVGLSACGGGTDGASDGAVVGIASPAGVNVLDE